MSEYAVKPLGAATWDAFVNLAEKHNGVWGRCWCRTEKAPDYRLTCFFVDNR